MGLTGLTQFQLFVAWFTNKYPEGKTLNSGDLIISKYFKYGLKKNILKVKY